MTKFFRNATKKKEVKTDPRKIEEIQKDLSQLFFDIGKIKYTIWANEQHLDSLNRRAYSLNKEGEARMELNQAADKAKAAVEGTKSE